MEIISKMLPLPREWGLRKRDGPRDGPYQGTV